MQYSVCPYLDMLGMYLTVYGQQKIRIFNYVAVVMKALLCLFFCGLDYRTTDLCSEPIPLLIQIFHLKILRGSTLVHNRFDPKLNPKNLSFN